jgi:cytochrome P450
MSVVDSRPVELSDVDLYGTSLYHTGNPHEVWQRFRAEAPVTLRQGPAGTQFWSVTGYRDVVAVLKDARFSSRHGSSLSVLDGDVGVGKTVNLMDPPQHGWIRSPSMRAMSAGAMKSWCGAIRRRVADLVRSCVEDGVVDIADRLAVLPMVAAGGIIGVPERDWPVLARWTTAGVAPDDPVFSAGSVQDTLREAHLTVLDILTAVVRERRRRPRADLVSTLLDLDFGGRPLTDEEVLMNLYTFVMGANITTGHVAAHFVLLTIERPDVLAQLKRNPAVLDTAVEEALRWASPANHLVRIATDDVEVGSAAIRAGDVVCAWLGSANRDESVFTDPFTFDPARRPNPHVAFGVGRHYCVGAPGARTALRALFEEMSRHVDRFEPAGEVQHLRSNFVNGITSLPVTVHPVR